MDVRGEHGSDRLRRTAPGTFLVQTYHKDRKVARIHDNLTMDHTSADYAVRRIYDRFDGRVDQLTAQDVRPDPKPPPTRHR